MGIKYAGERGKERKSIPSPAVGGCHAGNEDAADEADFVDVAAAAARLGSDARRSRVPDMPGKAAATAASAETRMKCVGAIAGSV